MATVDQLVAKDEIADVLARYCRGIDRLDLDLVRDCYHPDATDEHGSFSGTVDDFLVWVERLLHKYDATAHHTGRPLIEFMSATRARSETYGFAVHRHADGPAQLNLVTGFRYLDVFEHRGTGWRISSRVATTEWVLPVEEWFPIADKLRTGTRDLSDPAYG